MNSGKAPSCVPTWRGYVETTKDALLIFEACFNGTLSHCFRRPHDRERNTLVASGNVFVYEEATSGIKRWTDGIPWSPSRILTNFLIYRQLNTPFPPGEKKRATKRSQRTPLQSESNESSNSNTSPVADVADENKAIFGSTSDSPSEGTNKEEDSPDPSSNRGLVGSLVDSYEFKEGGLLKKTMTVTVNNVQHHLVSYYSLSDAQSRLKTPRDDPQLKDLQIRDALLHQPKFKFPNLDDAGDGAYDQVDQPPGTYGYYQNGYDSRMYPAAHHMGYAVQGSQYHYHPGYGPPPSHHHAATTYAHLPAASAGYHALPPGAHYPQHHSHHYYPQQPAPPIQHYSGPQHQQQHSAYPTHYYQPQQPQSHSRPPEAKEESAARPAGNYAYDAPTHIETGNDVYGPSTMTGPPASTETTAQNPQAPQAQTWPMNYPPQSYPSYRQQP